MDIPAAELTRIRDLYGRGLYRQAFAAGEPFGPLRGWAGPNARLLAGRLAIQLGAPKLGRRLHLAAFRASPAYPEAIYYHARYRMETFGPLACWEFARAHPDWSDAAPELRADWLALTGFALARLRDFDRSDKRFIQAEAACPGRAWVQVERAAALEAAGKFDDAMTAARRALELHPWFRPGVQAVSHLLYRRGRDADAIAFLTEAVAHLESGIVVAQLAAMLLDSGRPTEAAPLLDRYVELSPLLEPDGAKWLAARRSDVAYRLGDAPAAADSARKVGDDFYATFAARLDALDPTAQPVPARKMLPVALPTGDTTVSPAELLARFWNQSTPPAPAAVGPPSLDGLPDHAERHRFDAAGWRTREFTLSVDAANALIARGLPFFVTLVEAGFGQSRLAVGADPVRGTVFLTDGSEPRPGEAPIAVLAERMAAAGPRCLVAVPPAEAAKLDGLPLPDEPAYDQLFAVQRALADRDFPGAKDRIEKLRAEFPGHRLTKQAAVAWARATLHPVLWLDAVDALLADFPHDTTLVLSKAAALRELGRVPERTALLEAEGAALDAEPLIAQSLAQVWLTDPHRQAAADRLIRRSLRTRPHAAAGYFLLASQRWEHQRFTDAVDLYRFAACLDDREDQFADAYWKVARVSDQVPEALRLFQLKSTRAEVPNPPSVRAMFNALLDRDEPEQAFAAVGKAIEKLAALAAAPRSGEAEPGPSLAELLLFRAEQHANFGRFAEADADLTAAKPLAPPALWHKAAARVARTKPDYAGALAHVRDLIAADPLNPDAHRIAAGLTADVAGRPAARDYLGQLAVKYPDVYPLVRLRAEMLYREPDAAVPATQHLLDLCPHDAWAHRQLALVFADRRRHPEALAAITEAAKSEPVHPSHFAVLGHTHRKADRVDEALDAFREGVRHFPDHDLCVHELATHARGLKEKKAALRFVAETLHVAPHTGDGLIAYFEQAARLIDDPEEQERLHAELERFLDERPDLWQCWSLVTQHLAAMQRGEEAYALAKDATARFPLSAKLWYDLAEACEATNRPDERIDALKQAIAAAPGWPPVAKELADALAAGDDEPGAVAVLRRAAQRNPLDPAARWLLAEKLWEAGESEAALEQAKAAVRLEPVYDPDRPAGPDVPWGAVNVWSDRLDRPDEPVAFARSLTQDRAGDPRGWMRLARALNGPDTATEAVAALDQALALDPRNVDAYDLKAEKLAQLGRFDEALEAARPPALTGELPLSLQGRAAWIEAKRGNYAEAIPPMQALVAVDPEYVWGWQQLAEWYNDTGRPSNYLEAASELCRLRPESPFPLAMRGEAKIQTGDREGGKADLREALRIHPGYSPAAAVLFDACLADDELKEARTALAVLQEYLVGPEVLVKQVQYAARTGDADGAARAYREICEHPAEGPPLFLQMATAEMRTADLMDRAEERLREAWQAGEPFNPWAAIFWLDTPAAEDAPFDVRLAACDATVRHYPKFVPAHDRRAELFASAGRFDEAAAACAPPGIDPPVPVALRGRLAWIDSLKGDRERAIESMTAIVTEEPDYTWGWRQLERWYDSLDRPRDRLAAADQLVRLNPTDPLALGIRGEARRAVGDHRGAADDLRRAFELDPSFDAAGLQLVSAQLATDDLTGAARTLSTLREHADGPLVKLRAVQIAARQGDLAAARKGLQALGKDADAVRSVLREAATALADAGWAAEADEELDWLTKDPAATPAAAGLWAERLLTTGQTWKISDRLGEMVAANRPAAREAAVTYAWGMAVLDRSDATTATVQRFSELIGEDDDAWARAGAALAAAKNWGLAAAWLGNWKDRPGAKSWMLRPLADALLALGRDADAEALMRSAVEADGPDSPSEFRAWLAVMAAAAGDAKTAAAHAQSVDALGESDGVKLLLAMAEAVVDVATAAESERSAAFAEAKEAVRDAAGACAAKDVPPGATRWWVRCADRLATETGTLSATAWAWWQRVRPTVREG